MELIAEGVFTVVFIIVGLILMTYLHKKGKI